MIKKITFGYSAKNMGIPQNKIYLSQLTEKIQIVIKTMRWKTLCNYKETNGIKTESGMDLNKTPKHVNDFIAFENNLIVLAQDIRLQK